MLASAVSRAAAGSRSALLVQSRLLTSGLAKRTGPILNSNSGFQFRSARNLHISSAKNSSNSSGNNNSGSKSLFSIAAAIGVTSVGALWLLKSSQISVNADAAKSPTKAATTTTTATTPAAEEKKEVEIVPGVRRKDLPTFTQEQVAFHNTIEKRVWVTYKEGVYDITEFIESHPGGEKKIVLAAGGSIEPYWAIYAGHAQQEVFKILESLRIGNLDAASVAAKALIVDRNDPYGQDPQRHSSLVIVHPRPFNAETPNDVIAENFITPTPLFFVRNHMPVPLVDITSFRLTVEGEGVAARSFSLDELQTLFKEVTVLSTIQCSGNRRGDMQKIKAAKGLSWSAGAISNAAWTGVYLRDVLTYCGFDADKNPQALHVQFEGLDGEEDKYGASIGIDKAMNPYGDVLLAYKMNGMPLTRDHGFPLRVIVPGVTGARNVKWLSKIVLSQHESSSFWQQQDYKTFGPYIDWDCVDFKTEQAIQEVPVQSAIMNPIRGFVVDKNAKNIEVGGFAYSGGRSIIRVDVSSDGGVTWHPAQLTNEATHRRDRLWTWTLWSATIPLPPPPTSIEIICKATDSSYNCQPERIDPIWNLRGLLNNAWDRVTGVRKEE